MRYLLSPTETVCPLCGHRGGRVLWESDSDTAARNFRSPSADPRRFEQLRAHIETLWDGPSVRVVRCDTCSFCFADPYVAGDGRFYELIFSAATYPQNKWEYECTVDRLRELASTCGSDRRCLLEIGAGDGAFIRRVVPELFSAADVVCTEYSPYGIELLQQMGVTALQVDFRRDQTPELNRRFDVVCLFQVLEHLDRLPEVFARLAELTVPGGRVFIAVPNDGQISFNERHDLLLDMPPNHVGRWSRQSFETAADRYGWTLADHRIQPLRRRKALVKYATYRVMRTGQNPATLSGRVRAIDNRRLRRLLSRPLAAAAAIRGLPHVLGIREPIQGGAQWVEFVRTGRQR
jgi:SAM-dependent methyltransferase